MVHKDVTEPVAGVQAVVLTEAASDTDRVTQQQCCACLSQVMDGPGVKTAFGWELTQGSLG